MRAGGLGLPDMLPAGMTDAVRTPDEALEGLPDFPFASHYREVDGLRLAHLDEGDGAPVIFMHGEPTWSFLWRKVIPPVRDAGFRCIAPDLAGFGRSDKPIEIDWYSYDRHVELTAEAARAARPARRDDRRARLGRPDRAAPRGRAPRADRAARDPRHRPVHRTPAMTDAWIAFRDFVERTEDLPVGLLVRGACKRDPGDEVIAAYDAPYPNAASKAGARAFPLMIPLSPERPARRRGSACRTRCARTADRR